MTKADKLFREVNLYNDAMLKINEMMNECISDMIAAGIPVQKDKILNIGLANISNTHALCCFKETENGIRFVIAIKKTMMYHLNNEVVMTNVKNSIYHELLHTCPDCKSHNENFMKWSEICDKKIGTRTRCYMEDPIYYNKTKFKGFIYVCPECGNTYISTDVFAEKIYCELCNNVMER
mgnify:CR=1 FL=1